MNKREQVDVFDEDGNRIDTILRHEAEDQNHLTENVLIFIFTSKGQIWTQLRSYTKKHFPGVWDISACGGVEAGETRDEAAKRETYEEMGFDCSLNYQESFMNIFKGEDGSTRKRLSHLYTGLSDKQPVTNDEVAEVKCWDVAELRQYAFDNPKDFVSSFIFELDKALATKNPLS